VTGIWARPGSHRDVQDGDAVVFERLDLLVPTADGEAAGVAPRVIIEREEVASLVGSPAVHVLGHLVPVGVDICGRVSHGDLAVTLRSDVLSHITSDSLHVRGGGGGGIIVDDLVSREESEGIGVTSKGIDGREDVLQVDGVVRVVGGGPVERVLGGVDVEHEVDASVLEGLHAGVVVGGVVDGVDADGVDAQLLELDDVSSAAALIGYGVCEVRASTGLVVDTADVEAVVALEEGWWGSAENGLGKEDHN
jgi:hypothetical protein